MNSGEKFLDGLEGVANGLLLSKDTALDKMEGLDDNDTLMLYYEGRSLIFEIVGYAFSQFVKYSRLLEKTDVQELKRVVKAIVCTVVAQKDNVYSAMEAESKEEYDDYLSDVERGAYADGQYTAYAESIQALRNFLDNTGE